LEKSERPTAPVLRLGLVAVCGLHAVIGTNHSLPARMADGV
jgi:hypothetical protein